MLTYSKLQEKKSFDYLRKQKTRAQLKTNKQKDAKPKIKIQKEIIRIYKTDTLRYIKCRRDLQVNFVTKLKFPLCGCWVCSNWLKFSYVEYNSIFPQAGPISLNLATSPARQDLFYKMLKDCDEAAILTAASCLMKDAFTIILGTIFLDIYLTDSNIFSEWWKNLGNFSRGIFMQNGQIPTGDFWTTSPEFSRKWDPNVYVEDRLSRTGGKRSKFLTKLWCCGEKYYKITWFYQLGW